jgi:hypothetical protein
MAAFVVNWLRSGASCNGRAHGDGLQGKQDMMLADAILQSCNVAHRFVIIVASGTVVSATSCWTVTSYACCDCTVGVFSVALSTGVIVRVLLATLDLFVVNSAKP